jgi:hypothetical protein
MAQQSSIAVIILDIIKQTLMSADQASVALSKAASKEVISHDEKLSEHLHAELLKDQEFAKEHAVSTLRSLFVLNGGSVLVSMTFLGALLSKPNVDLSLVSALTLKLKWALVCFGCGLTAAVLASGLAYLNYNSHAGIKLDAFAIDSVMRGQHLRSYPEAGKRFRTYTKMIAILCCFGSFLFFFSGGCFAYKAFISLGSFSSLQNITTTPRSKPF